MLTVPLNSSVRRHSLSTTYDTGPSRWLKGGVGPDAGGGGDSFAGRDVRANRTRRPGSGRWQARHGVEMRERVALRHGSIPDGWADRQSGGRDGDDNIYVVGIG